MFGLGVICSLDVWYRAYIKYSSVEPKAVAENEETDAELGGEKRTAEYYRADQ